MILIVFKIDNALIYYRPVYYSVWRFIFYFGIVGQGDSQRNLAGSMLLLPGKENLDLSFFVSSAGMTCFHFI